MSKNKRIRLVSDEQISQEQALWLCRAILTHYRSDGLQGVDQRDFLEILNRISKQSRSKLGREWSANAVGYNLEETWYGSDQAGIWEAWATLVALAVSRQTNSPVEHRTYRTFGLAEGYDLRIGIYHITEVISTSADEAYHNYVKSCFERIVDSCREAPEYDPTLPRRFKEQQE